MLLVGVLQDALRAEHFFVVDAVELHFLRWMLLAVLDGTLFDLARNRLGGCGHG